MLVMEEASFLQARQRSQRYRHSWAAFLRQWTSGDSRKTARERERRFPNTGSTQMHDRPPPARRRSLVARAPAFPSTWPRSTTRMSARMARVVGFLGSALMLLAAQRPRRETCANSIAKGARRARFPPSFIDDLNTVLFNGHHLMTDRKMSRPSPIAPPAMAES